MSPQKAPSHGTKVTPRNPPVTQEATGPVAKESLAAESVREGGEFSQNRENQPENVSASDLKKSSSATHRLPAAPNSEMREVQQENASGTAPSYDTVAGSGSKRQGEMPKSYAGEAPSYVANQYYRDPAGPHGKDIKEVDSFDGSNLKDGQRLAMKAEPGSKMDPGRAAELQFEHSQVRAGRDAGPKQSDLNSETKFDPLGSDVSA